MHTEHLLVEQGTQSAIFDASRHKSQNLNTNYRQQGSFLLLNLMQAPRQQVAVQCSLFAARILWALAKAGAVHLPPFPTLKVSGTLRNSRLRPHFSAISHACCSEGDRR